MKEADNKSLKQRIILWLKRVGFWGFIFFLVKGLIWLAIAWWAVKKK